MEVISEIDEVRRVIRQTRLNGRQIGCVPTMGALHAGHLSLIEECRKFVDYVCVTIFVNPTQFGEGEDLAKYPRPLEDDLAACKAARVDLVYTPEINSLYPVNYDSWVEVERMSEILEGEYRPTHFRGVTTIVAKLFNIVQPDVACFGAKDYQQQAMIRQMVRDLNFPIEIKVCPTIREPDGLAMSSRNAYLSATERESALLISQTLKLADELLSRGTQSISEIEEAMVVSLSQSDDVRPQYAVVRHPETLHELESRQDEMVILIAAYVGQTRLIDNRRISLGHLKSQD